MIIPIALALGTIFLVFIGLCMIVYIPMEMHEMHEDKVSPITMEYVKYGGVGWTEKADKNHTICNFRIKAGDQFYDVDRSVFKEIDYSCPFHSYGYIIHQRRHYIAFIYDKTHVDRITNTLKYSWDNKYNCDTETGKISQLGLFLGIYVPSSNVSSFPWLFFIHNGNELITLGAFTSSNIKLNMNINIGTMVKVTYKGDLLESFDFVYDPSEVPLRPKPVTGIIPEDEGYEMYSDDYNNWQI